MGTTPQVLHRTARAISTSEFYDAIQATCYPRFPGSRGTAAQRVVLAISGGVDSMALAYLCRRVHLRYPYLRVSDNIVGSFVGVVVDHGLREGSDQEAMGVAKVVRAKTGIRAEVLPIKWKDKSGAEIRPHDLPNFETVARQLRYDRIAAVCLQYRAVSFFTAHNQDDQYETVLMRLLSGHGYRGLQGMRAATDIPECYTRHRVYQSGIIDDQMEEKSLFNQSPTRRQNRRMRRNLIDQIDLELLADEFRAGLKTDPIEAYREEYDGIATGSRRAPALDPMPIEDGGVMLYRPLLEFSKDRLIATCLENGIPWFEDHTNHDPTFTRRNAVRYMCKNHKLPVALQKPAVIEFAQRCKEKVAAEKAETDRLFKRTVIHDFEPNVGTVVVEIPEISFPTSPRRSLACPVRFQKRTAHYRTIAALLIRRLISLVTPERELTPVQNLDYVVSLLFPSLAGGQTIPRKPYVICGVHFQPLEGNYSLRWLLSRAPYPTIVPKPSQSLGPPRIRWRLGKTGKKQETWPMGWTSWELYDGRFWICFRHRFPALVEVAPFEMEYQKPFRAALDRETKTILDLKLKRYAPGKIRYTLPAIYAKGDVDSILEGRDYWAKYRHLWDNKSSTAAAHDDEGNPVVADGGSGETASSSLSSERPPYCSVLELEREAIERAKPKLLALPTLGIQLPGLEDHLGWEIRYRKVDIDMPNHRYRFWVPQDGGGGGGVRHRSHGQRRNDPRSRFGTTRGFVLFRSARRIRPAGSGTSLSRRGLTPLRGAE